MELYAGADNILTSLIFFIFEKKNHSELILSLSIENFKKYDLTNRSSTKIYSIRPLFILFFFIT